MKLFLIIIINLNIIKLYLFLLALNLLLDFLIINYIFFVLQLHLYFLWSSIKFFIALSPNFLF